MKGWSTSCKQRQLTLNRNGSLTMYSRGKKIFRKFDDAAAAANSDDDNLSDLDIRHKAGGAAHRPFTRSSIKPRLLFQKEERREAAEEADEEALTDIEMPHPSPTKKRGAKAMSSPAAEEEADVVTPVKNQFQATTPPSTGRPSRAKKDISSNETIVTTTLHTQLFATDDSRTPSIPSTTGSIRAGMSSPFDQWSRSKSGVRTVSATKGTKREGTPLANGEGGGGKRTRSAAYSGAS
jgi:hypothetical protein